MPMMALAALATAAFSAAVVVMAAVAVHWVGPVGAQLLAPALFSLGRYNLTTAAAARGG